jgi:hypothetical protein
MLPDLIKKLISATQGNFLDLAALGDQATGSHIATFFTSTQEKLDRGLAEDTRDAILEMLKQVAYNATQLRIVIEILDRVVSDEPAIRRIEEKWQKNGASPESSPELRDLVVGGTLIAPAAWLKHLEKRPRPGRPSSPGA